MMKITVTVEMYTGAYKEKIDINISDEEIKELAEKKAREEYYFDSCEARGLLYEISI